MTASQIITLVRNQFGFDTPPKAMLLVTSLLIVLAATVEHPMLKLLLVVSAILLVAVLSCVADRFVIEAHRANKRIAELRRKSM